jgi:hypothetical protein
MMLSNDVTKSANRIIVGSNVAPMRMYSIISALFQLVQQSGYREVLLDFSDTQNVTALAMLAVCGHSIYYRNNRIKIELILPEKEDTRRLFRNANWAHLIDPEEYEESGFRGYKNIPAYQYNSLKDQFQIVNKMLTTILGVFEDIGLTRTDFGALEWSINEITDNVLAHSNSSIGGLVQMSTFDKTTRSIEFSVLTLVMEFQKHLKQDIPILSLI